MASIEIRHPWTLCGLIGAFVELALAYYLLAVSTFAFFASKFLRIIGLRLPCPCDSVFGYQSVDLCWHRLLMDWPVTKIYEVQMLAKRRFPFNSVSIENERKQCCQNCVVESEACSSSFVDRESGSDVKGKRILNPKQRLGIRRRRRAVLAFGKSTSVSPADSLPSASPVFSSACGCRENGHEFDESLGQLQVKENGHRDEVTCHTLESSRSFAKSNGFDKHSIWLEKHVNVTEEKRSFIGSESDRIRMLERALEEEKAVCSALYLELENERAAAATAADEAMAMIARLQKDKASMAIEARQYERMIEEKFAYDEEEIDILKEILIRKEKDNHFLEKEVETYRRMSVTGDEQSTDDISDTLNDWGQRQLLSSPCSIPEGKYHKHSESDADFSFGEKQSQFDGHELIEKTVILVDSVDCTIMLDSVPEDMNDGRGMIDDI